MEGKFVGLKSRSGVPIWYLNMPHIKNVAIGVVVGVGSRDEKRNEYGLAHATEHMVFCGSQKFPDNKSLIAPVELAGGEYNACTGSDDTLYWCSLPSRRVELGFDFLGQLVNHPIVPEEKIEAEKRVIFHEINEYSDSPDYYIEDIFNDFIYGKHPLSRKILGVKKSVVNFQRKDFLRFLNKFYHPGNYTFIVVGNIASRDVKALFDQYFPQTIDRPANAPKPSFNVSPRGKSVLRKKEINQSYIVLGSTTGPVADKTGAVLSLFEMMIDGGSSFLLCQEIRENKGLCYEVEANNRSQKDMGSFYIRVNTDKDNVKEVIDICAKVIEDVRGSKKLLKIAKEIKLEKNSFSDARAEDILWQTAEEIVFFGSPMNIATKARMIKEVTIDDVKMAVDKFLSKDKMVRAVLMPK